MNYYNNNSCVNLNTINDTVFWGNNSSELIEVQPIMWPPIITYTDEIRNESNSSILYYQWCGPLIVMLKLFAIHMNANVRIYPHMRDGDQYFADMMSRNLSIEGPHILLYPFCPVTSFDNLRAQYGLKISRFIGFFERSVIISKTVKYEWPLLSFVNCFANNIYYSIIITLILSAILFSIKSRKLSTFFSTLFALTSALISDLFRRRTNSNYLRIFVAIWLLMGVILLSIYSGTLYDLLIRKQPTDRIDSWNDLYTKPNWKKSKIYAPDYLEMSEFIAHESSEMALEFKKRAVFFDPFNAVFDDRVFDKIVKSFIEEDAVIVLDSFLFHYFKIMRNIEYRLKVVEKIDYHLSKSGAGAKPYFIVFLPRANKELKQRFNYIMIRLDESGIYEHEVQRSLKPKGYGPDINAEVDTNPYEFGPLTMTQMKGVFAFFMICTSFNIFVFLMELFTYYCLNKILDFVSRVWYNSRITSIVLELYYFYIRSNRIFAN